MFLIFKGIYDAFHLNSVYDLFSFLNPQEAINLFIIYSVLFSNINPMLIYYNFITKSN